MKLLLWMKKLILLLKLQTLLNPLTLKITLRAPKIMITKIKIVGGFQNQLGDG